MSQVQFELTLDAQYKQDEDLRSLCVSEDLFSIKGELFKGNYRSLVREYICKNPSLSFRIWLIENGYRVQLTSY